MKKVLFASTALIASAGIAAADGHSSISFGGAAGAGIYDAGSGTDAYSFATLTATMTSETDSGIEFGASLTMRAGTKVDFGDDEYDGAFGSEVDFGNAYISGSFGTLTIDSNGIDNLYDDDFSHDIMYAYSVNSFTATVTFDVSDTGVSSDHYSLQLLYNDDTYLARFEMDDSEEFEIFASYSMSGVVVGLEFDSPNEVVTLHGDYTNSGFTVGFNYNTEEQWDINAGYSMDGISVSAEYDESDAWTVRGGYELGTGLSAQAYYNSDESFALGLVMGF